ncbi:Crp/Fnr family transcriptional regulator [Spirosoma panaciterrae]|uniref:Crp/Fnr family transcriptional regulator n=1 Tax=Spirosoma panaciterrae TaxID=496058 RepID=UPI000381060F|nr:Crp/Fnr family transcriptional regulator [Spirosoma panaciterrae]
MLPPYLIAELNKANVAPHSLENIFQYVSFLDVKNQTQLIRPGQVCDQIYFVMSGSFVCRYIDEDLEIEKTINFFMEDFHPFMSCVDSFFSGEKTRCELRAIAHSTVLALNKHKFESLIDTDLNLFRFYHSVVTTALQEENDFKLKIISYTSEQLYQYLISTFPIIIQRVPSRFIAEFMGISPEWLSKLKHKYRD